MAGCEGHMMGGGQNSMPMMGGSQMMGHGQMMANGCQMKGQSNGTPMMGQQPPDRGQRRAIGDSQYVPCDGTPQPPMKRLNVQISCPDDNSDTASTLPSRCRKRLKRSDARKSKRQRNGTAIRDASPAPQQYHTDGTPKMPDDEEPIESITQLWVQSASITTGAFALNCAPRCVPCATWRSSLWFQ